MIVRRVFVAAVLTVGLVGVAAPGASAATVSPSEWAPKFCSALTDYQSTITQHRDHAMKVSDKMKLGVAAPKAIGGGPSDKSGPKSGY